MVMIMKSLMALQNSKGACQFPIALFAVFIILTQVDASAAEYTISKMKAPSPVLILSNSNIDPGVGFAIFDILYPDIPAGTLVGPKQLLEISWRTTYYPGTINEDVELCYFLPFSSQNSCEKIYPNASGTLMLFNDQAFGHGSKVVINHKVLGGARPYARPAGVDSVSFKYRY
jgi:hypothetical protein